MVKNLKKRQTRRNTKQGQTRKRVALRHKRSRRQKRRGLKREHKKQNKIGGGENTTIISEKINDHGVKITKILVEEPKEDKQRDRNAPPKQISTVKIPYYKSSLLSDKLIEKQIYCAYRGSTEKPEGHLQDDISFLYWCENCNMYLHSNLINKLPNSNDSGDDYECRKCNNNADQLRVENLCTMGESLFARPPIPPPPPPRRLSPSPEDKAALRR